MRGTVAYVILTLTMGAVVLLLACPASAETLNGTLTHDASFIRFIYNGLQPEVMLRIPFSGNIIRIQRGDLLEFPLDPYVDVKIPLTYRFSKHWFMHLTATMERMYLIQSPVDIISHNRGVPLNSLGPNNSTQQLLLVFGLTFSF